MLRAGLWTTRDQIIIKCINITISETSEDKNKYRWIRRKPHALYEKRIPDDVESSDKIVIQFKYSGMELETVEGRGEGGKEEKIFCRDAVVETPSNHNRSQWRI